MIFNLSGGGSSGASLNFKVVGGTTEPANPSENTIWVNTDEPITSWIFSAKNPVEDVPSTDLLNNVSLGNGYLGSDGGITSSTNDKYTNDYIPVTPGRKYDWSYTVSSNLSLWMIVVEYDSSKNVIGSIKPVDNVETTKSIGTYVPSSEDVKYVRLSWRHTAAVVALSYRDLSEFEGMVWFKTGVSSDTEFNALKNNGLQTYPSSAFQCNGSELECVDAQIYQDGEWFEWITRLYKSGNECTEITGGWTQCYSSGGSITKTGTGIKLWYSAANGGNGTGYATEKKIDLTDVNTIELIFSNYTRKNNGSVGVAIHSSRPGNNDAFAQNAIAQAWNLISGQLSFSLDVSNFTGEYYVCFTVKASFQNGVNHAVDATLVEVKMS